MLSEHMMDGCSELQKEIREDGEKNLLRELA